MKRKVKTTFGSLFPETKGPEIPAYGTGEVAQILRLPIWRVQKFLDSPQYNLSPERKLGSGHGSRRVFTTDDIVRIAIAVQMVKEGFAAKFVGSILEEIEDYDLSWKHDQEGNELPPPAILGLIRGEKGRVVKLFDSQRLPTLGDKDSPYYFLNLDELKGEVDKRIAKMKK